MILIIRIAGRVNIPGDIEETMYRLLLRRKFSAVLLEDNVDNRKKIAKIRDYIAYGTVKKETMEILIEKRGESLNGKEINGKEVVSHLGKKTLKDLGVKPFFRLHPPRKGIDSKKHFGINKGVLGDHGDKINLLLERML